MARAGLDRWRLSPAARGDLDDIWTHTVRAWSIQQAETYLRELNDALDRLLHAPEIGRERPEIDPPVRLHPFRAHVIVYRIEGSDLIVLRVAHRRRRWQSLLDR